MRGGGAGSQEYIPSLSKFFTTDVACHLGEGGK